MTTPTHAVVLGGGMAGMLGATVLARHVDTVTVVDRDRFPDGPELRKGVPQAKHAHVLMSGGARAVESLLPGTIARLIDSGAHRVGMPRMMVTLTPGGWQHRFPETQYMIASSRALLDWVVRDQTLADDRITLVEGTDVTGFTGTAGKVTGVRVKSAAGEATEIAADLVIDTAGRGSRLKKHLAELGVPPVREDIVDAGLTYATKIFRAPEEAWEKFPVVGINAAMGETQPGRYGLLLPIEDGRWIVTLSGTRGGEPPSDEAGFYEFARSLRHPILAYLIAAAEPLTDVQMSRSTVNRRLYCEQVEGWPEGFVVMGDPDGLLIATVGGVSSLS